MGEWIEDVVGHSIEDTSDLWKSLKSGVILVELINIIRPNTIKKYNNKQNLHVLMERENINLYLEACWKIGLSSSEMFITSDLHSRRNMQSVLNNIAALSEVAPTFGNVKVEPLRNIKYPKVDSLSTSNSGPSTPKPTKSWNIEVQTGPVYAEQLEGEQDLEFQVTELQKQLSSALQKVSTMENSNMVLKADLTVARKKIRELGTKILQENPTQGASDGKPSENAQNLTDEVIESLKKENEDLNEKIKSLNESLVSASAAISATATSGGNSNNSAALSAEIAKLKSENLDLSSKLKTQTSSRNRMQSELEQLGKEVESLRSKVKKFEMEGQKPGTNNSNAANNSNATSAKLEKENQNLKSQLADNAELRKKSEELIGKLRKEISELETRLSSEKAREATYKSKLEELESLKKENLDLRSNLTDKNQELEEFQLSEIKRLEKENASLRAKFSEESSAKEKQFQEEMRKVKAEVISLKEIADNLENDLKNSNEKSSEYSAHISLLKKETEEKTKEFQKLKKEMDLLKQRAETAENAVKSATQKSLQDTQKIGRLEGDLENLNQKFSQNKEEISRLKKENEEIPKIKQTNWNSTRTREYRGKISLNCSTKNCARF